MSKLFFESTKIDVYPAGFRSQEFIKSKITSENNLTEISKQLNNTIALKGLNYIVKLDGYVFTFDVSDLRTLLDAQTGEVYCTIAYRELSDVGNVLAPILDNNDETVVCLDVGGEFKGLAIEVGEHSGDLVTEGSDTSRRSLLIGKFESNTFTPYFSLHLGQNTFSNGKNTISEGYYANTSGDDSISIGNNASVIGNSAIALGNNAKVSADEAVQIGEGENTQANSIKFGDKTINQDLIPSINNTSKLGNNSNTWNEVNTYDCKVFNDLEIDHDLSVANSASITHNLSSDNSATNNLKVNEVVESNLNPDATANNRVLGNNSNKWKEAYISNVHGTSDKALNDDKGNAILSTYAHSLSTGNASQGEDNTLQLKDGQANAETLSTVTISNVASANFAKKANVTTETANNDVVKFNIGDGTGYNKTITDVASANFAKQANVTQTSTDSTNSVAFNIGNGSGFSQTINNVSNANYAAHIGTDSNHSNIGNVNYPVYVDSNGIITNTSKKLCEIKYGTSGNEVLQTNLTFTYDSTTHTLNITTTA